MKSQIKRARKIKKTKINILDLLNFKPGSCSNPNNLLTKFVLSQCNPWKSKILLVRGFTSSLPDSGKDLIWLSHLSYQGVGKVVKLKCIFIWCQEPNSLFRSPMPHNQSDKHGFSNLERSISNVFWSYFSK